MPNEGKGIDYAVIENGASRQLLEEPIPEGNTLCSDN